MPEGDVVSRTAARLHAVFAGRALVLADLRWPGLSTYAFAGRATVEVVPRGKHLLHRLEGGWTIHSHLRMDGSWRVQAAGMPVPPTHTLRAVLGTDEYTALGDKLGMLDVVRTADEASVVGHLGPDLLGSHWDADGGLGRAVANLGAASGTLSGALLDQTNLAGLGTIWSSESLFACRLDPFAEVGDVPPAALRALVERARRLLTAAAKVGGPGPTHNVHGRNRRPCRRCGTPIEVRRVGPPTRERPISFCPRCQAPGLVRWPTR